MEEEKVCVGRVGSGVAKGMISLERIKNKNDSIYFSTS